MGIGRSVCKGERCGMLLEEVHDERERVKLPEIVIPLHGVRSARIEGASVEDVPPSLELGSVAGAVRGLVREEA